MLLIKKKYLIAIFTNYRANASDWSQNYEKITDMIVPRSSSLITQDQDFALFNVTLFKKVILLKLKQAVITSFAILSKFRSLKSSNFMLARRNSSYEISLTTRKSSLLVKMKLPNLSLTRRSNL